MNLDPYRNETPPRREVLPGGTVLLSVPMRTAHSVTLGVWLRTGSQDEPSGLGGVSHFLEHIVFKGTLKHRLALRIEAGTVNVNEAYSATWASIDAPMGGVKDSGLGRRHGIEGLLKYTDAQTIAEQRLMSLDLSAPWVGRPGTRRLATGLLGAMRRIPGLR